MTDALNISKMLEQACKQGLIDAGVNDTDTFLNFWQVSHPRDATFPQIAGACSPDIPDGTDVDAFSEFRTVHCQLRLVTTVGDDETRETLSTLYVQARTMLDTANAQRETWQTALLIGCQLNAVVITDSPVPYIEQLPNGAFCHVMDLNFDAMMSVT